MMDSSVNSADGIYVFLLNIKSVEVSLVWTINSSNAFRS